MLIDRDSSRRQPTFSSSRRRIKLTGARRPLRRPFSAASIALAVLVVVGVTGFRRIEELTVVDSLYMTVITISTVGFGEIPHRFSPAGRLFTVGLIIAGVSIGAYVLSNTAQFVLSAEWQAHLAERRRKHMVEQLSNHIIVCGYGRVGTGVVHELLAEKLAFVVIELDNAIVVRLREMGQLALTGNAADEELLREAGISRASGIVVCASSDAENVYITLTARGMRPDVKIVARAAYEESAAKLVRAGADRVILPFGIAGKRMVSTLIRPDVADFIEEVSTASGLELFIEQVQISHGSAVAGMTLAEANLETRLGISVHASHAPRSKLITRPGADLRIEPLTVLVVLGTRDQLLELMFLAGPSGETIAEPMEDIPPLPNA